MSFFFILYMQPQFYCISAIGNTLDTLSTKKKMFALFIFWNYQFSFPERLIFSAQNSICNFCVTNLTYNQRQTKRNHATKITHTNRLSIRVDHLFLIKIIQWYLCVIIAVINVFSFYYTYILAFFVLFYGLCCYIFLVYFQYKNTHKKRKTRQQKKQKWQKKINNTQI